jgi:hypothetical protein
VSKRTLHVWLLVAVIGLAARGQVQGAASPSARESAMKPSENAAVDIAPWGERTWSDSDGAQFTWEDPRDVCRIEVTFSDPPPDPAAVRLQWWQSQWPERRIPRDRLSGAGESGWLNIGDWYQGRWRDADARLSVSGDTWTWTVEPVNRKEFPGLKDFAAAWRTTMKVRLAGPAALKTAAVRVFSDATWKAADLAIEWGGAAEAEQVWDGRLEVFNGYADRVEPLDGRAAVTVGEGGAWKSAVRGRTAGVRAHVWFTASPNVNSFDRTVVTVRARQHSFSFDAAQAAGGARVFSPMYGVLVRRADDAETYAGALAKWKSRTARTIYERVFDEPEQTFERAWADMPPKRQFYIPLGCEGGRQRFGAEPDGSVFCRNDRIDHPRGKDTPRRTWGGNALTYRFGLPSQAPARRWIEDGCLPIIHAEWQRDGIRYTQTAFATRLEPGGLGWPDLQADDTTVLVMRILCENTSDSPASARLGLAIQADGRALPLAVRDSRVYAAVDGSELFRGEVSGPAGGRWQAEEGGKQLALAKALAAGEKAAVVVKIPFITLDQPAELERLRKISFDEELDRVRTFWRTRADASCQIRTPVPPITNFYRAHVSHLLINGGREVRTDRLMARVGSFSYGVYGNESCMMITDLDRRGLHREAERCLETFLAYQGTAGLPGDYASQEGVFNGAGGWESGGYNQHHGWILWAMAEHYRYAGDRGWLERNADKLIKACRWIIGERARTRAFDPASLRGIERGLLPPGSLEDIGDWRCWLSNNVFSWWGLDAVARALADVGHPQAKDLLAEADAYRADLLAAFKEAMVRSPLVRLSDGTWIPAIPSEVHRRGRTFGWITVTLEGPIYLVRTGALAPDDPLARCIMQDYEDNLYLSQQYGYPPENLADHWFCRGGFSMQPNLLCSPHPYLLRDEPKHFLRAYFNALAVCYYPNTQMLTEHPLPGMGDWRGDHYKSSDESNSTYWLRLAFVDERGEDLCLGMAVPRAWLADGGAPAIERAATYFGPLGLRYESHAAQGSISAVLDPPTRRPPKRIFLRFRHPEARPIVRVQIDGKPWDKIDAKRELVELPPLRGPATITAFYGK